MEKQCEVLVVGAGVAGIAAAVSAARCGVTTALVEKNNFPGGTAITGLHRFICGLYANGMDMPDDTLNDGMAQEICSKLHYLGPEKLPVRIGKVYVLPFATETLLTVLHSLLKGERLLEVLYNTEAVSVTREKNAIAAVGVRNETGAFAIAPQVVIDCSGGGVIVQLSGARYRKSPSHQRQFAGYAFRVTGLQAVNEMTALQVPYCMAQAVIEKKMPAHLKFTTFTAGDASDEGYCKLCIPPLYAQDRNELARNDALLVHRYLSQRLPEFRSSTIIEMAQAVVDREGLRVLGEYTLTSEDVLSGKKFFDGVVKNSWPIELWCQEKGPHYQYLAPGDFYEIPLRCLRSQDITNLYCAGRCISASHEARGSTRVMGACISLGEQAGRAATALVNV